MTQELIFSPAESAKLAIDAVNEIKRVGNTGIKTGIAPLDEVMLPLRPAELAVVLGYTSWYKSGFMNFVIKSAIKQCHENDVVIKVTWEDSVEEDTIKWIASDSGVSISTLVRGQVDDWEVVMNSYNNRLGTPLWLIGHSNQISAQESKARPRMTMNDVIKAMDFIRNEATDSKYKIRLVVLDYLQRIRPDRSDGESRREQMQEAVNKAKDMAISFGSPVMLGVQASRAVLDRDFKLPRLDDGLETSNIEQSADKVISLWYPSKTEAIGKNIDLMQGKKMQVSQNLLILGLLKQKMGLAPVTLPLYVNPEKNLITGIANL